MNILLRLFCCLLLLSTSGIAHAQLAHVWAKALSNKLPQGQSVQVTDLKTDEASNTYITGHLSGVADFDPGPGVYNLYSTGYTSFFSLFFAKYDANGQLVFAKSLPGNNTNTSLKSNGIAIDSMHNIYLTGQFRTSMDFDPSVGTAIEYTTPGTTFLAKYDPLGNYVFHRIFPAALQWNEGVDIAVDKNNQVLVCGDFATTVDFDGGVGVHNVTAAGTINCFVARYDAAGTFMNVFTLAGTNSLATTNSNVNALALDSQNNIYITGTATAAIDFDPGAAVVSLAAGALFFAKYTAAGALVFVKVLPGNSANVDPKAIAVDKNGQVGIGGNFSSAVDFDPGAATVTLTPVGFDGYFAKYDASGNYVSAGRFGTSSNTNVSQDVAFDSTGNMYVTGYFSGTVDMDPGAGVATLGPATTDLFLAKYGPTGNFIFAKHMPGNTTTNWANYGLGLEVDPQQRPHIGGMYIEYMDMDPSPSVQAYLPGYSSCYGGYLATYDASGNYVWADALTGGHDNAKNEEGSAIVRDTAGNIYVTGYFIDTLDFDPGPGLQYRFAVGGNDAFLAKYNAAGDYVYAVALGSTANDSGNALAVDAAGNAYITGTFGAALDFDPGPGFTTLTPSGTLDIYLAKYGPTGNMVFAGKIGGSNADQGNGIGLDASNNIYLTGHFRGTADFDIGAGVVNLNSSSGSQDIFLAKYSSSGTIVFAKGMVGPSTDAGHAIAVEPSGTCYLTGSFQGIVDFDPSLGTANLSSGGTIDAFVAKYDANGIYQFALRMGSGTQVDEAYAITYDANGNLYTTGYFSGSGDFDPGATTFSLFSSGSKDGFLVKLNPSGGLIYAINMGGLTADVSHGVIADAAGNAYVTGSFTGTCDFGPSGGTQNLTSNGLTDIFLCKYDPAGNFLYGGNMGGHDDDRGTGLTSSADGKMLLTGSFMLESDMDPGPGVLPLGSNNGKNIFFGKFKDCNNSTPSTTPTVSASDSTVCSGTAVTLTANTGLLNDASDWQWYSGSCGVTAVGLGASIVVHPTATTTYFARGEGGCVPSGACGSLTITVTPLPAAPNASSNSPVIQGNALNLTATTVLGATYSWTGPNGFTSTQQNPSIAGVTGLAAGIYTVTSQLNGCSSMVDSTTVVVITTAGISGTILHPNGVHRVRFTGVAYAGPTSGNLITGTDGSYNFPGLTPGGNYTVTPSKANDSMTANGITTLDLVLMQQHILNQALLNSPYKILAADVNNSGSVSTLDVVLTRTVILQTALTFPSGRLWSMVDASYVFPNAQSPWPFPSTRNYPSATTQANQDFYGIKLGDVNWSWNPSLSKTETVGELPVYFGESALAANGVIRVPVLVKDFDQIAGYQFTLTWDPALLNYVGVTPGATGAYMGEAGISEGYLTVSWNDPRGEFLTLADGSALFYVEFQASGLTSSASLAVNSSVVVGEAYDRYLEVLAIVPTATSIAFPQAAVACFPNPFSASTIFRFSLAEPSTVRFVVSDLSGRVVGHFGGIYSTGTQDVVWDGRGDDGRMLSAGTYLVSFAAGDASAVLRVVVGR